MKYDVAAYFAAYVVAAAALALAVPVDCWAQTSPGLTTGQIPGAAQWNAYFSAKQDYVSPGASGNVLTSNGASWSSAPPAANGTVTSVGLALPNIFTVTGSPVATGGTLTGALAGQPANTFFAAPDLAGGLPVFRAIVPGDVPTLNQNTTGNAATATTAATASTATTATNQSGGTINTGNGNNSLGSGITFGGIVIMGAVAPDTTNALKIVNANLTGGFQTGVDVGIKGNSAAVNGIFGMYASASTAAASFTTASLYQYYAANTVAGAGSTISIDAGFVSADRTSGTSNYGFQSLVTAGPGKLGFYGSGNADNNFGTGTTIVGTLNAKAGMQLNGVLLEASTSPAYASGGCAGNANFTSNGTAAFSMQMSGVCSGSQPIVFTMPAAAHSWACKARNAGAPANVLQTGAQSATSVTIANYSLATGAAQAWTSGDVIEVGPCVAY